LGEGFLMEKRKTVVSFLIAAILSSAVLTACNTVSGAGEDLSAAGNAIDRKATDVKNR
jgi:predicted small secreted protein